MLYDIEYRRSDTGDEHYWYLFMTDVPDNIARRIADNLQDDFGDYILEVRLVVV